jgi:hypothetical protein
VQVASGWWLVALPRRFSPTRQYAHTPTHRHQSLATSHYPLAPGDTSPDSTRMPTPTTREVDRHLARRIGYYSTLPPEALSRRLRELDQETPLETVIYRSGAVLTIASVVFMFIGGRRWGVMALVAAIAQLLVSDRRRSCVTELLRRRGYRPQREIFIEKQAIEAIRGDFSAFNEIHDPHERARKCLEMFV